MKFIPQTIPDVIVVEPEVYGDERGYFVETFRQDKFEQAVGRKIRFIQDNESKSRKGVLRGLHYQLPPYAQSKLVRVVEGKVLDVAVDIRVGSPTFGQYVSVILSSQNKKQLFIPRGFAHGFVTLSDTAIFSYKVDNYYSPECDRGISYKGFGINWKLDEEELQLSEKDRSLPRIDTLNEEFSYFKDMYA